MNEHEMDPQHNTSEETAEELSDSEKRLNELDELQQQVARRLKDNQRFLERFMDDSFEEEMEKELADDEDDEDETFEEL